MKDQMTKLGEHFEGVTHELDGHVFVECTFRDVELRAMGTAPFAFTGCTFLAGTRFTVSPEAMSLLHSLLYGRENPPIAAFLRALTAGGAHPPRVTLQ